MLGKRLKRLRSEKKLTQMELAEKIGVTHVSISGYESGKRTPDTETLTKIADFFNVSTDFLLGRTDSETSQHQEDFKEFISDPDLQVWYKELPINSEEELRQLKDMWDVIKKHKK